MMLRKELLPSTNTLFKLPLICPNPKTFNGEWISKLEMSLIVRTVLADGTMGLLSTLFSMGTTKNLSQSPIKFMTKTETKKISRASFMDSLISKKPSMLLCQKLCLFVRLASIETTKYQNLLSKLTILTIWSLSKLGVRRFMPFLERELCLSFIFENWTLSEGWEDSTNLFKKCSVK